MSQKIYKIHSNYERPFTVIIENDYLVKIFKNKSELKPKLIHMLVPKKIFIGKSVENKMTKHSGGFGDHFDGNTILLQLDKKLYMHIGDKIKYIKIYDEVKEFNSPVGNNDVPYPWVLDVKNRYYLIIEDVVLSGFKKRKTILSDPYEFFYRKMGLHVGKLYCNENFWYCPSELEDNETDQGIKVSLCKGTSKIYNKIQ